MSRSLDRFVSLTVVDTLSIADIAISVLANAVFYLSIYNFTLLKFDTQVYIYAIDLSYIRY